MKILYQKIGPTVLLLAMLTGCTLSKTSQLPSPALANPDALAFSADKSLKAKLSGSAVTSLSAAEAQALNFGEPGEAIVWSGRRADVSGSVTAFQFFRVGGSNCRRFVHAIKSGGQGYETSGTACRASQDAWSLVE